MKKWLVVLIIMGLSCTTIVYIARQHAGSVQQNNIQQPQPIGNINNQNATNPELTKNSGRLIGYTPLALSNNKNKRIVLFFFANWCPTCKAADKEFKVNLNKIPSDVVIVKVNYNDPDTDETEKNLATKYSISYQHTFVQIDENGTEVTKWNGGDIANLNTYLK